MASRREAEKRQKNTRSDLWGQCSEALQQVEEAVGGVLKTEKELRLNTAEVRAQVHSAMSRQQEALRCRELWLLSQIEIIEQVKSETLQQQLLQINQVAAQLDLISDQLQKQPISNELKNHLTNQLSSVLQSESGPGPGPGPD
ncbi:hypothetical protein WMY93_032426 [Mugilogobius chulae]|uniref:Nuclear receptor coactivator 4 N-terminal domain-containing protein n=1 Tax=Mugilogobius chulae TaxID=88201 RepID=A0AAW0MJP4_9GOBI